MCSSDLEPAKLRDGLFPLGITLISAGSHTEPGGYTGAGKESIHQTVRGRMVELAANASEWAAVKNRATNATGQFEIADERSPDEIAALVRRLGYEPVGNTPEEFAAAIRDTTALWAPVIKAANVKLD